MASDPEIASISDAQRHLRAADILERVADAFLVLDREWRIVYANREACRINQKPLEAFVGRIHWEEWPAAVGTEIEHQFRRVMSEKVEAHFEHRYVLEPYDVWLEIDVYPADDGISLFYRDISARKRTEEALRRSQEDLRLAVDAAQIGTFYCDYPLDKIIWNDNCKTHFFLPLNAEVDFTLFYSLLHPEDRETTRRAIERALAERVEYDVEYRTLAPDGRTRWVNAVGRFYYDVEGNPVRFDGITLDISQRKKAEEERERLLTAQRARAEREALINRIGQALRNSSDPEAIQAAAVNLLGEALEADRCYFAVYDLGHGGVTVARDWHREGLPSIQGEYPFANTAEMFHELYRDSTTSVVTDAYSATLSAQTLANMESLGLRSRVSVALTDEEGLMATLTAAMADSSREWADEEVALIEAVATQLRTAVEMARVTQREHNIASQLQEALQPDLPGTVPGLALTRYYRPALAQTEGVGGDFYDVYAVEKGCTALVVGDLSGKGLAAAAQVSTVRNMLRAFLYSLPTVAEAVTKLNRVLAEHNLLTGFTTLFVGAYDSATGLLNYVNCGQEPALVRRAATGMVELLEPTGPILGTIESAQYKQFAAMLTPGDAVAIFTDGLTEVGASRKAMLGVEGVTALLAGFVTQENAQSAGQLAETLAQQLISGVDAFARMGARDDMCLLVGVIDKR